MKICVLRHGETDWNALGKLQGRENIPLNQTGITQAIQCTNYLKSIKWDYIITSPLSRACQTSEILANQLSIESIVKEEGLIERDYGFASGLEYKEYQLRKSNGTNFMMESHDDLSKRMFQTLNSIIKKYYPHNVILVSHGSAINSLFMKLQKKRTLNKKEFLKNACMSLIEYKNETLSIIFFNKSSEDLSS